MKSKTIELVKRAGFPLRPHLEGVQDGIDWSAAAYGYDQRIEELVELVVRRCVAQVAVVGLAHITNNDFDDTGDIAYAINESIVSIKAHFEIV